MKGKAAVELDDLPLAAAQSTAAARSAAQRNHVVDVAKTAVGYLTGRARATPDRTVLVHGDEMVSYQGLTRRVAAVRRALLAAGCGPGQVVASYGPRSVTTLAVLLALESIGAVYLPLDLTWPEPRLAEILRRSSTVLAVDHMSPDGVLASAGESAGVPVLGLGRCRPDEETDLDTLLAEIDRERCADSSEPRYLNYTSGTTGVPKGALVEHRGMVNHLWAKIIDLALDSNDRLAFTAPLAFDIAICQMLMPVLVGGTVVVLDDEHLQFPRRLVAELEHRAATVIEVVPTILGWLVDEVARTRSARLPGLRWVISTGEELRRSLAQRVFETLPHVRLLNSYGFTETSDDVAHHEVRPDDLAENRLPVGSAVINSALYVLVHEGSGWRAALPGEAGELFVGGLPVSRGYPDNPEATKAAFFKDPLDPNSPTGRLYRTGDAAMLRDGLLYCLGRLDRQTKIAGVRIEPGEVEAALLCHPAIAQCAVLAHSVGGTPELVAFYVAPHPVASDVLRRHVSRALPPAMVPRRWFAVDALPLTTNGKVDYQALSTHPVGDAC